MSEANDTYETEPDTYPVAEDLDTLLQLSDSSAEGTFKINNSGKENLPGFRKETPFHIMTVFEKTQPPTKRHNRGIYILSSILTFKPLRVTTFAFRHLNHSAPKLVKDVFNILQKKIVIYS